MGSERLKRTVGPAIAMAVLLLASVAPAQIMVAGEKPAAKASKGKKGAKKPAGPRVRHDPAAAKLMGEGLRDLQRGETSNAISSFRKAVRREGSVSSYFLLGWAHYQRGFKGGTPETADRDDAQSAIDAYSMALAQDRSLDELPDPSRLHFSMALCYEAVQNYDRALESYKNAFRAAPMKALIPLHAARLRLKMGDEAKAVSNVKIAMNKAMGSAMGKELRDAARRDAAFVALLENPETRKALELGVNDDFDDYGFAVAALDARGEDLRDSVRDTAPRRAPPAQDAMVLDKIALANLEFKSRRYLTAVEAYNDALAMNQERLTLSPAQISQIYEKIGTSYNKLGRAPMAIAALQKALEQFPVNSGARYQMALAYGMAGKTAAGLQALREALQSCGTPGDLRRMAMQARADTELEAVRDLHGFRSTMAEYADRLVFKQ